MGRKLRGYEIILGFLVATVLWAGVLAWQSSQSPEQGARSSLTQGPDKHGFWEKAADDPVAYFTLWLVVFTGVLAASTIGLWFVTWRTGLKQVGDLREGMRARMSVEAGGVRHAMVDQQPGYHVHVQLRNFGATPAYRLSTWVREPRILEPSAVPFDEPIVPLNERATSIIGPQSDAHINWYSVFSAGEVEAIRNRERAIFVWGGADYVDIFGNPRTFRFRCMMIGPEEIGGSGGIWALKAHPLGYDAD